MKKMDKKCVLTTVKSDNHQHHQDYQHQLKLLRQIYTALMASCAVSLPLSTSAQTALIHPQAYQVPMQASVGISQMRFFVEEDATVIELTRQNQAKIDVEQQGQQLIISSLTHQLDASLVGEMAAVGQIRHAHSAQRGLGFVSVLKMHEAFGYQVTQMGDKLLIRVQPTPTAHSAYRGERVSLEFQDIPVRAALEVLANFTNLNIVADDSVTGNITTRLVNVPWDQALAVILQTKQLSMVQQDDVLLISSAALSSDTPLQTEYIRLKYAMAEDVQALIIGEKTRHSKESLTNLRTPKSFSLPQEQQSESQKTETQVERGRLLSERGTVAIDKRTNTLIVQDVAPSITRIYRLINEIDVPVRQVMIQARIVSANESFGRDLGVSFGARASKDAWQIGGSHQTLWDMRGFGLQTPAGTQDLNVNLSVPNPVGRLAFGLLNLSDAILDLELSAMQAENRGEVISTPKVLTTDKQTARISSGVQIPYQEATSSGATSTSFKEASLVLEATPNITPDGKIMLKLNIKNGVPITSLGNIAIQEDAIETNVIVEHGQTVVLGGIYRESQGVGVNKVPLLGDIPILGRLFRSDSKKQEKSELLIFITPTLVAE